MIPKDTSFLNPKGNNFNLANELHKHTHNSVALKLYKNQDSPLSNAPRTLNFHSLDTQNTFYIVNIQTGPVQKLQQYTRLLVPRIARINNRKAKKNRKNQSKIAKKFFQKNRNFVNCRTRITPQEILVRRR